VLGDYQERRTQDQCPPSVVSPYASRHQVLSLHLQRWSLTPDQPTSTHGNYPGTASDPIWAYHSNGRQRRHKADLDLLAFCVLEETTRTTADDLDEDSAEWPQLPRAVMDRRSRPGPEPTTLEAVGNQWHYAPVVVQAEKKKKDALPCHSIKCQTLKENKFSTLQIWNVFT